MDGQRFDDLAIGMAAAASSRRGVLRALIASAVAAATGAGAADGAAATCRAVRQRCTKDRECCSRGCAGARKGNKGRCACISDGKPCTDIGSCCNGGACKLPPGLPGVCCVRAGKACPENPQFCCNEGGKDGGCMDNGSGEQVCCNENGASCRDDAPCCTGQCGTAGTINGRCCIPSGQPCVGAYCCNGTGACDPSPIGWVCA